MRTAPTFVVSQSTNSTVLLAATIPVDAFVAATIQVDAFAVVVAFSGTDYRHLWHRSLPDGLSTSMVRWVEGLMSAGGAGAE